MPDIQLYYVHEFNAQEAIGDDNESRHLSRVMRKQVGDLAHITSGNGELWQAEIMHLGRSQVIFKPLKLVESNPRPPRLAIAVAPTKQASRIEDLLEKAVEMGLTDLYLIRSARTQRKEFKTKRIAKMAIAAMKQSARTHLTTIHEMMSYDEFLTSVMPTYEMKYTGKIEGDNPYLVNCPANGDAIVLIGPEGDFTDEEYAAAADRGVQFVKLSENRLRTETAGIVALSQLLSARLKP